MNTHAPQLEASHMPIAHDLNVLDVAQYFIDADSSRPEPDVTPLKLQKLLYLAQGNYLAATGRRMFNADVEAFEHGPVVYDVFTKFRNRSDIICVDPNAPQEAASGPVSIPKDAQEFLNKIWDLYKDYSASELRRLTHVQDPWKDFYDGGFRTEIPDSALESFFSNREEPSKRVLHETLIRTPENFLDDDDEADAEVQSKILDVLRMV